VKRGRIGDFSEYAGYIPLVDVRYEIDDKGKALFFVPSYVYEEILKKHAPKLQELIGFKEWTIKVVPEPRTAPPKSPPPPVVKKTGILVGEDLDPALRASEYIVADHNREAVLTAEYVLFASDGPSSAVIHGPPGVGKTHLIQAMGWKLLESGKNVVFFRAQSFINVVIRCFREQQTTELNTLLTKNVDAVLIDDFQHMDSANLGAVRHFFFSILDTVLLAKGKVLVTSDTKPEKWKHVEERIQQRLKLFRDVYLPEPSMSFAAVFVKEKLIRRGRPPEAGAVELLKTLRFKSVRELNRLVDYLASRGTGPVGVGEMEIAIANLFGIEALGTTTSTTTVIDEELSRGILPGWLWRTMLYSLLPSHVASAVEKNKKAPAAYRRIMKAIEAVYANVLKEREYSLREIAEGAGVSKVAVYKWVKYVPENDEEREIYKEVENTAKKLLGGFK